jgi:sulfur carrier protein
MLITVAGNKKEVKEGLTIDQLIDIENVESPLYVTVSVNDEFIKREEFQTFTLKENDTVEFLYFMGGGCY